MSRRVVGKRPGHCGYCGRPAMDGRSCGSCHELEQADPLRLEARRPLTEAELGLVLEWPEGEPAADDGPS